MNIRFTARILVLLAIAVRLGVAQHSNAYVFAGLSTIPGTTGYTYWHGNYVHTGLGGEGGIGSHLTVGGEAGALISIAKSHGKNAGVLSVGPAFYPFRERRKLDPFIAGGVSLLVAGGVGGMWYAGGGANYWLRDRVGLRFEMRAHFWSPESGENINFVGARIGLCFR